MKANVGQKVDVSSSDTRAHGARVSNRRLALWLGLIALGIYLCMVLLQLIPES